VGDVGGRGNHLLELLRLPLRLLFLLVLYILGSKALLHEIDRGLRLKGILARGPKVLLVLILGKGINHLWVLSPVLGDGVGLLLDEVGRG